MLTVLNLIEVALNRNVCSVTKCLLIVGDRTKVCGTASSS